MNFKDLLKLTEATRTADSFRTTGEAMSKERATGDTTSQKAKDAARKRAERAKQIPRDRKPKGELVKEIIAVKTESGRVQLIFKDSFDKNRHIKLNKGDVLTEDEAKQFTGDPKFEQTRASKLLFGDVKTSGEKEEKEPKKKETEEKEKSTAAGAPEEEQKAAPQKAKRMSKEEIMQAMQGMNADQLSGMPKELQQEYFQSIRKPMNANNYDNLSFETLSNEFGINTLSSTPYNQQVLNALLFAAKIKAGASQQELQTLFATSANSLDFTKAAFLQANKILSQIGDECIQNLVSSIEAGSSGMYSDGVPELQCGDYRFKISAGGEFTISTNSLNQGGKIIRGIIGNALSKTLTDPNVAKNSSTVKKMLSDVEFAGKSFSANLLPDQSIVAILSDPNLTQKFKSYKVTAADGKNLGYAIDANGNINPGISLSAYETSIKKAGAELFKNGKKNDFLTNLTKNVLNSSLRGDGLVDPKTAPNHIITANGVFPMSDDYIGEISKTATVSVKKREEAIDHSNMRSYNKASVQNLQKWRTVIEQVEPKKEKEVDIKKLFIDRKTIDPLSIIVKNSLDTMSFDINASLLPGFKPEDINAVEYNYVTIGKKTTKIPVTRTENLTNRLLGENYSVINEMLIESLSNNFLLSRLNQTSLISNSEKELIEKYGQLLIQEEDLRAGCLVPILNKIYSQTINNPEFLIPIFEQIIEEEYKRDYKKEYRNYHGKAKQRKQSKSFFLFSREILLG